MLHTLLGAGRRVLVPGSRNTTADVLSAVHIACEQCHQPRICPHRIGVAVEGQEASVSPVPDARASALQMAVAVILGEPLSWVKSEDITRSSSVMTQKVVAKHGD
ncbi:uncharacterized protein SETTUDRAFT_18690 [Exserohilum turcica Et28A]|uniref:Uncharacterized protein n=1 Tax=Exserohilum turcicum (strain 28A) TaxID=671987 RepID=R0KGP4_EXST2|nr:uncharacterized protein SETTUDRAFT_18690 [Exserohilum turcica Et28A]EOA92033.1 hypothetical protein SETTUDRAFT_18690 [Exserohilum turcica Et28A]